VRLAIIGDGLLGRTIFESCIQDCCHACYEDEGCGCEGCNTYLLPHSVLDVTDPESIDRTLETWQPEVVVNTAAYHRLVECEKDPAMAYLVNEVGVENVASRAPTIFISTDYVFNDGGPHEESLPGQRPLSVYGRSKLAGELATLKHGGIVVRVSALFGHYPSHKGPTFPETILSSHDPISLPTDQRFSPTYAPDAAAAILSLVADINTPNHPASGIYHAVNRGHTTWADFAESILLDAGHERHVLPRKGRDPIRPKDSSLANTRLPTARHWRQALGDWAKVEGRFQRVSPTRD
jgi:dTDP-4-dehydrorhamnose reductase